MTSGYFDLGDGKLYYEVSGDASQETLVLSHAAFLDSRMWQTQWAEFSARYRTIRYDMLGFGQSDLVTGPRTRRDDLYALLQHLDVTKAHLLGCSMGGEIVLDLALEYPDLAQSLVIVNGTPSGFEPQGEPPRTVLEMIEAMQAGDLERVSELQLCIWVDGPHRTSQQIDAAVRQQASEMNRIFVANNTWAIADMQPINRLEPPALERLSNVQAPALIVAGALDDPEMLRASDLMAAGIPQAQMLTIENSAHVPNMEKPDLFNHAVLEFLATG